MDENDPKKRSVSSENRGGEFEAVFLHERQAGIDGITSATIIPLKIAINTGFVVSGLGFAYMIFIIFQALFSKSTVEGWASTMSVILFLGGIQLIFLGVLGEYLGRIFMEVKGRPNHLVKNHFKAKA